MPNVSQNLGETDAGTEPPCTPEEQAVLLKKGFKILEKINYGSFSKVYKAQFDNKDIAVKVIDLRQTSRDYRKKFLPRELEIMQRLRHPNIITIHKIFTMNQKIYVFMDLATGGDILEYLKQNGPIPEPQAKMWFKQVCEALKYIHSHGVAHRDLKSENILLDSSMNAKLTDFGFCRMCMDRNTGKGLLSETYCGSAAYVAPEVLKSTPYNPMLSDVWSLGVVLFVMVNNALPFDDRDLSKMVNLQMQRQWHFSHRVDKDLSSELKDLVKQMLDPDLSKRPTVTKVLRHPWLKDVGSSLEAAKSAKSTLGTLDAQTSEKLKMKDDKSKKDKNKSKGHKEASLKTLPTTNNEISKEIARALPKSPATPRTVPPLPNITSIQSGEAHKVLAVSSADPKSDIESKKSRPVENQSGNIKNGDQKKIQSASKNILGEPKIVDAKKTLSQGSTDKGLIGSTSSASSNINTKDDSSARDKPANK